MSLVSENSKVMSVRSVLPKDNSWKTLYIMAEHDPVKAYIIHTYEMGGSEHYVGYDVVDYSEELKASPKRFKRLVMVGGVQKSFRLPKTYLLFSERAVSLVEAKFARDFFRNDFIWGEYKVDGIRSCVVESEVDHDLNPTTYFVRSKGRPSKTKLEAKKSSKDTKDTLNSIAAPKPTLDESEAKRLKKEKEREKKKKKREAKKINVQVPENSDVNKCREQPVIPESSGKKRLEQQLKDDKTFQTWFKSLSCVVVRLPEGSSKRDFDRSWLDTRVEMRSIEDFDKNHEVMLIGNEGVCRVCRIGELDGMNVAVSENDVVFASI